MQLRILFCFINTFIFTSIYAQPRLQEQGRYFENYSFGKISIDETGIWAISGDSTKIYHFDLYNTLQEYPQFNAATTKKFTGILAKGGNKVLIATAGDYLLSYSNGTITKLGKSAGILNGNINSLYGDANNTIVGTDSLAYEAKGNYSFLKKYSASIYESNKVSIVNNFSVRNYPYARKRNDSPWSNYYLEFYDINTTFGANVKLDEDENPVSSCGYFNSYSYIYIATNKSLKYFERPNYDPNGKIQVNVPAYDLYMFMDNYHPYVIAAMKNGLYIASMYYSPNYSLSLLNDLEVYDLAGLSNRTLWLATNKGLIRMSMAPSIYPDYTINHCESNSQVFEIKNSGIGDIISWYRNDTLLNLSSKSITVYKGGRYYAVVKNPVFGKADTTKTTLLKTDFIEKTGYYSYYDYFNTYYDSITICKGTKQELSLQVTNYKGISWLRDGIETGITGKTIYASEAGKYSALVANCNNIKQETGKFELKTIDKPIVSFNVPKENTICATGKINLEINTNADYSEFKGPLVNEVNNKNFILQYPGTYVFSSSFSKITGCLLKDTLKLNTLSLPYALVEQKGNSLNASSLIKDSEGQVRLSFKIKDYQWFLNNSPMTGATDSTISLTAAGGNYKVKVTDFNGCSNFSNNYQVLSLYTSSAEYEKFQIQPNPSSGPVRITGNPSINISKIEVYNSYGTILQKMEGVFTFPTELNLGSLTNGTYLIRLTDERKKQYQLKIILQK